MWQFAKVYGIPATVVEFFRNLYIDISSCVRLVGVGRDWLPIQTGLKQVCVISPSMFNNYMYAMKIKVTEDVAGGVLVGFERAVDLDFVDDMDWLADSRMVMAALVIKLEQITQKIPQQY